MIYHPNPALAIAGQAARMRFEIACEVIQGLGYKAPESAIREFREALSAYYEPEQTCTGFYTPAFSTQTTSA